MIQNESFTLTVWVWHAFFPDCNKIKSKRIQNQTEVIIIICNQTSPVNHTSEKYLQSIKTEPYKEFYITALPKKKCWPEKYLLCTLVNKPIHRDYEIVRLQDL